MTIDLTRLGAGWLLLAALSSPAAALAASTGTSTHVAKAPLAAKRTPVTITFSEYAVGTTITTQYQRLGIVFGGASGVYIENDSSNPTSPVLSGLPRFTGPISAHFVTTTGTKRAVGHLELDAGYFDTVGSTAVTVYNRSGVQIGQQINSRTGIEHFSFTMKGIASFTVAAVGSDTNGFAVDNVTFPKARPPITTATPVNRGLR